LTRRGKNMDFVLLNNGIPMEINANIQGIPKISNFK
jgi:hypothetical protein